MHVVQDPAQRAVRVIEVRRKGRDIAPGDKGLARAGQHDAAQGRDPDQPCDGLFEGGGQRDIQRVEDRRPVEGQRGDAGRFVMRYRDEIMFRGHAGFS